MQCFHAYFHADIYVIHIRFRCQSEAFSGSPCARVRRVASLGRCVFVLSCHSAHTPDSVYIYTHSCSQLHSHTLHVSIYIALRQPSFGAPVPGRSLHASSLRVIRRACGSTVWLRSVVHPFAFVRILYISYIYIYVCSSRLCICLLPQNPCAAAG